MATTFPADATLATLVGGSTGALVTLTSITHAGIERVAIPTSSMDTSGGKTHIASAIYEPGEYAFEGLFDGTSPVTLATASAETWTLSYNTSGSTDTMAASGFITSIETTGEMEDAWKVSGTIKLTGSLTYTPGV